VTNELNKSWAKKLVNAILREINRQKSKLQKQIHYSHPTWLLKKIRQYYPNADASCTKQDPLSKS
jgi:16S rRNA (cytosine967-C5)-methyltransferase